MSTGTNVVAFLKGSASGLTFVGTRATGASPRGIATGDFNHDGLVDVAVASTGTTALNVLYGAAGGGSFTTL